MAQWNAWGPGWKGMQESNKRTLDAMIRREHAKTYGPAEVSESSWGTGLPEPTVAEAFSSPCSVQVKSQVTVPEGSQLNKKKKVNSKANSSMSSNELERELSQYDNLLNLDFEI